MAHLPLLALLPKQEVQPPTLRDYQTDVIRKTYAEIRKGEKRILIVAGTGSGKTVIASKIVADAVSRNRKVLFIVHLDVLVGQTYEKFAAFGIDCGFIKAGWRENRESLVQIASAQTLPRRDWWKDGGFVPDVIILDEAHETSWIKVVSELLDNHQEAIAIGLTATPYRLSKKQGMGDKYNVLIAAPTPGELIEKGYLAPPIYYGIKAPDLSKIKTIGGDYAEDGLSNAMNRPEVLASMLANWKRLASDRKTIAFAVDVAHSKAIAQTFNNAGIRAEHLDGSTPIPVRQQMFRRLATGQTQVLSSCQALQIGFDCPPVNCVLFCRPTKSKSIYFQQLGRGLRTFPGKDNCLVLDQSGNVARFGFVEDVKRFRLTEGKDLEGEAPIKTCPDCGRICYCFAEQCPDCGYLFPKKDKELPIGEMIELKPKQGKINPQVKAIVDPRDDEKRKFLKDKLKRAWQYKLKPGWVFFEFKKQYNHAPKAEYYHRAIFGLFATEENKNEYWTFLLKKLVNISQAQKYYAWEFGEARAVTDGDRWIVEQMKGEEKSALMF